jgi:pectinesterase
MKRRALALAAAWTALAATRLPAQAATPLAGVDFFAPARLTTLAPAERDAWERYLQTSRRSTEIDRDSIDVESQPLGARADRLRALLAVARDDARQRRTILRGLDSILLAQFPNGCWPRVHPLRGGADDAIDFADGAMPRILRLLREAGRGGAAFVPTETRLRAAAAVERGAGCIAAAQVVVDGRRTAWSARHDPLTLAPVSANGGGRAMLGGAEAADVFDFLMEMESPDPRAVLAARGAGAWLKETALYGYAPGPLWARAYEIGTNRPDSARGVEWRKDAPAAALARYEAWSRARAEAVPTRTNARLSAVVDWRHGGADGARVSGVPTYRTLGAALAAAPLDGAEAYVVSIRDGRYREKLSVETPNVHLMGESRDGTVLTYDVAAGHASPGGWPYGTRASFTLRVAAPGFRLERMTVENAFDYMANHAKPDSDATKLRGPQAVAVMLDEGSDRAVFRDCRLSGHQDTLFPNAGRAYFARCEVLGSVDFIFGAGRAVFEDCDVVSRDRGGADNGYVTAPSTPLSQPHGFLFVGGRLRKETPAMAPASVALGRPWHPMGRPDAVGSAVFIGVWMDDHVSGWAPMNSRNAAGRTEEHRPEAARFFEHGSTGPGAASGPSRRVLTAEQAREHTVLRVLDGWNPRR